ncbi:MAG: DUF177 domain-containing protein [Verrucomicrobia bacterium]|nr:MAG: DUF177 domain-containing protein [Verrucomicrobiota bacterium]
MKIEIPKLAPEGEQFTGAEPAALLQLDVPEQIRAEGPIQYDFFAQLLGHELVVRGSLSADLAVTCGRCAEMFSTNMAISDFLRTFDLSGGQEIVDLTDDIREEVLLHLPHYPVCKPDCQGLCPQCGCNLNQGACDCKAQAADLRWSGLDGLKLK